MLIVDDPLNANKEYSKAALDKWTSAMATRANDPTAARHIIIMQKQRIHQSDPANYILEKNMGDLTDGGGLEM